MTDKQVREIDTILHGMFYRAMLDWREQGRSDEQIYAINNFNTGVGVKLRKEIATLIEDRERAARIKQMDILIQGFLKMPVYKTKDNDHIFNWLKAHKAMNEKARDSLSAPQVKEEE